VTSDTSVEGARYDDGAWEGRRTALPNNDTILLQQVVQTAKDERWPGLDDDRVFEHFACEQVLRGHDLSADEIAAGVVGGGNDGGIDGVYVFLADSLVDEDSDVFDDTLPTASVPRGSSLVLWLVQAKRETSFTETAIDLVSSSCGRLLDLTKDEGQLLTLYSPQLVARISLFRRALLRIADRHPKVSVRFLYVSYGDKGNANPKVLEKANDLIHQFSQVSSEAIGVCELVGASDLWKLASSLPSYTLQLRYKQNATSGTSHVALVSVRDFLNFITTPDGKLHRHIFDWNVRDYEGDVEVNREISQSLGAIGGPDFWWLNNGITIVCSQATIVGDTYTLDDVQIVNGLQTSHTIFNVASQFEDDHPSLDRSVLVRIIRTDDAPTRDQIIRATNSQTKVPQASLRATDEIHRAIEAYFLTQGWYYDRRKNYYRNNGKSPRRIVGIPLLAQSIMAMGLSSPDNSRARPSSLLKRDEDYAKIFSPGIPLQVYLWVAEAQRAVDDFLLSAEAGTTAPERTNLRFHLSMLAAAKLAGGRVYAPAQLGTLAANGRAISDADLPTCLAELKSLAQEFAQANPNDSADKIAKGREFVEFVLSRLLPAA